MKNKGKFLSARKLLAICTLLVGGALHAQPYPTRPITLLIPYPPGGSAGMLALPLLEGLQKKLGQPVVLMYKPGSGGILASTQLARANPDGYTLLMVLTPHAANPALHASLPYDTQKDFAPVSLLATLPLLVAAPLKTPADTIPELIKYAKANPDKLTFASAGNGNTSHLAGEMFKTATGTKMLHVPYKGSGPAVIAMLRGEVSLMFDSISTSLPQVKGGKLKALAVTGEKRSSLLPDVPTMLEAGVKDFVVNVWYAIIAPADTPKPIIDQLSIAFSSVVKDPKISQQLAGYGYETVGTTPDVLAAHFDSELVRWKKVVQESGAKVD